MCFLLSWWTNYLPKGSQYFFFFANVKWCEQFGEVKLHKGPLWLSIWVFLHEILPCYLLFLIKQLFFSPFTNFSECFSGPLTILRQWEHRTAGVLWGAWLHCTRQATLFWRGVHINSHAQIKENYHVSYYSLFQVLIIYSKKFLC